MRTLVAQRRIDLPHLEMDLISVHLHGLIGSVIVGVEEIEQLPHGDGDLTVGKGAICTFHFIQCESWVDGALVAQIMFIWPVVSESGFLF